MFAALLALAAALVMLVSRGSPETEARLLRDYVAHNLTVAQPVHVRPGNRGLVFPDAVRATQQQLDYRLRSNGVPYRYPLVDELPRSIERLPDHIEVAEFVPTVDATNTDETTSTESADAAATDSTDSADTTTDRDTNSTDTTVQYVVELMFHDLPGMWLDVDSDRELRAVMTYNLDMVHRNDVPFFLTQTIYDHLLDADLRARRDMQDRPFAYYRPAVRVNFVAAEELGVTPPEIQRVFEHHLAQFDKVRMYVDVQAAFHVLDVTKKRAPPTWTRNSTTELTFFYLTTLKPYANSVQGVPLYHIDLEEATARSAGDAYGTEYLENVQHANRATYNVTRFLDDATAQIEQFIDLPSTKARNLRLRAEGAMKHYTINGIVELLDKIIDGDFDLGVYKKICALVDEIVSETEHDWLAHLHRVHAMHQAHQDT